MRTKVQAPGYRPSVSGLVVIGASTGGPQALQQILTRLPANFPMPILCVQHISKGFMHGLVQWLAPQCAMEVKIAESGERPAAGTVYFPKENTHLDLDAEGRLVTSNAPPINVHRPSVTVTFRAAARLYGKSSIGILLTGMGQDGVQGLGAIAQAGGITIAQDEKSCVVFGMPKCAIESGVVSHVLPLSNISSMLMTTPST